MICDQCHIPGFVETASGLCQSCDRAAREQEGKGDGDVERLTKERDGIAAVLVAEQGCRRDALEKLSEAEAEVERLRDIDEAFEQQSAEREGRERAYRNARADVESLRELLAEARALARATTSGLQALKGEVERLRIELGRRDSDVEHARAEVRALRLAAKRLTKERDEAREQEAKGDGELDEALSLLSLWWEHGDKGDHEEARLLHRDTNALLRRHGR